MYSTYYFTEKTEYDGTLSGASTMRLVVVSCERVWRKLANHVVCRRSLRIEEYVMRL